MIGQHHLYKIGLLTGLLLLAMMAGTAEIQVQMNGRPMRFSVPPTQIGGRTMVPLRGIFEALGARVDWNEHEQSITATRGNTIVFLSIGNTNAQLNGRVITLDAPAMILDGSTMVPLRFVGESFGAEVSWMEATQTVFITTTGGAGIVDQSPVAIAMPEFSHEELEHLLAPIALYPDPLLAQVLPASTFPEQLVEAEKLVHLRGGNEIIDHQNWDVCVKAVAYYPETLKMMVDKPEWTTAIGQAEVSQPKEVMRAIQRLRHKAREYRYLDTNEQQRIYLDGDDIRIVPVNPRYIYVPKYEPSAVFVQPRRANDTNVVVAFGVGLLIGSWLNRDVNWHENKVFYHGWKGEGWVAQSKPNVNVANNAYVNSTYVNKTVIVNNSVTTYNINTYRTNVKHDVTNNVGHYSLPESSHTLPQHIAPPPPVRPAPVTHPTTTGHSSTSSNPFKNSTMQPTTGTKPTTTSHPSTNPFKSSTGQPTTGTKPTTPSQPNTVTPPATAGKPTITAFTPSSGALYTTVTITGTNFNKVSAVKFNGVASVFTPVNSTTITAKIQAGTSNGPITVTTPSGTATSTTNYNVITTGHSASGTQPTTTGQPTTGTQPATTGKPNTTSHHNTSSSGQPATSTPTTPTGQPATTTHSGKPPTGQPATSTQPVIASIPTISSFTPSSGTFYTTVTITGTNFNKVSAVKFNGVASVFTPVNLTTITAKIQAGSSTGPITVTTSTGTATSATNFTVKATGTPSTPPTSHPVSSTPPATSVPTTTSGTTGHPATTTTGTPATPPATTGHHGTSPTGQPTTGTQPATTGQPTTTGHSGTSTTGHATTSTQPTTTSKPSTGQPATGAQPANQPSTNGHYSKPNTDQPVTSTRPATTNQPTTGTKPAATDKPTIASFAPSSGALYTVVTITGTNFVKVSAVKFNGVASIFSLVNQTTITAKIQAGSASGPITVITPSGTATSATNFTVK